VKKSGWDSICSLKGVPLGITPTWELIDFNKQYSQTGIKLQPGEKILLYTDGLSEAGSKDDNLNIYGDKVLREQKDLSRRPFSVNDRY